MSSKPKAKPKAKSKGKLKAKAKAKAKTKTKTKTKAAEMGAATGAPMDVSSADEGRGVSSSKTGANSKAKAQQERMQIEYESKAASGTDVAQGQDTKETKESTAAVATAAAAAPKRKKPIRGRQKAKPLAEPASVSALTGPKPAADVMVALDRMSWVLPMDQLLVKYPHLCPNDSSPARCIGSTTAPPPSAAAAAAAVDGKDEKKSDETTTTTKTKPVRVATPDKSATPLDHTLWSELQKRANALPRALLASEMATHATEAEHTHQMTQVHAKRAGVLVSLADHESFLLRGSGRWSHEGVMIDFPPCFYGQECILNDNQEMRFPAVGTGYLFPVELRRLLDGTQTQFPCRPCVACTRYRVADCVLCQRSSQGMVDTKGTVAQGTKVLDILTPEYDLVFGAKDTSDDSLDAKITELLRPFALEMHRDVLLQPYVNLYEREGGYFASCMLVPTEGHSEGLVGPIAVWRRDLIVETKSASGQPIYDQSRTVFKGRAPALVPPGTSQSTF